MPNVVTIGDAINYLQKTGQPGEELTITDNRGVALAYMRLPLPGASRYGALPRATGNPYARRKLTRGQRKARAHARERAARAGLRRARARPFDVSAHIAGILNP